MNITDNSGRVWEVVEGTEEAPTRVRRMSNGVDPGVIEGIYQVGFWERGILGLGLTNPRRQWVERERDIAAAAATRAEAEEVAAQADVDAREAEIDGAPNQAALAGLITAGKVGELDDAKAVLASTTSGRAAAEAARDGRQGQMDAIDRLAADPAVPGSDEFSTTQIRDEVGRGP